MENIKKLIDYWKNDDFDHQLGPWEGTAPYLQATSFNRENDYDIHDLMGFVQMLNWDHENN